MNNELHTYIGELLEAVQCSNSSGNMDIEESGPLYNLTSYNDKEYKAVWEDIANRFGEVHSKQQKVLADIQGIHDDIEQINKKTSTSGADKIGQKVAKAWDTMRRSNSESYKLVNSLFAFANKL